MRLNIEKKIKDFIFDRNVRYSFLLLFLGTLSLYIFQILLKKEELTMRDIHAFTGVYAGSFLSIVILYIFLIKPRIRLISFLLTVIVIITFGIGLNEVALSYGQGFNFRIKAPQIESKSLEVFLIGMYIGSIIMSGIYLILSKLNTVVPIIALFLVGLANDYYWFKGRTLDTKRFTAYLILLCLGVLIASLYSLKKYEINRREIISFLKSKTALIILFIFLASTTTSIYSINWLDKTSKKIEVIQEQQVAGEQRELERKRLEEANVGVFGQREPNNDTRLIGYYKAKKPLHLKTEVLFVDQKEDILFITPVVDRPEETFDFNDREFMKDEEEIQMIYSTVLGQPIPSAEKISGFSWYLYSGKRGLLFPSSISSVRRKTNFIEYYFNEFDKKKYDSKLYNSKVKDTDKYANISEKSQRYNELKSLAQKITRDDKTDYDKAKSIESYLKNNYLYSLTPSTPDQINPIDDFLFDTKKGYCTYFAASMTMMLNTIGVQSRMVGGFYSNLYSDKLGAYVMTNKDLHAWVEVFIDGYGWVTFDPTTSNLAPDTRLSDLTGNAREFTNYSKEEADKVLKPLGNVRTSFEDLFAQRDASELPSIQTATTFEDVKQEWVSEEDKDRKLENKAEEERRRKQEEIDREKKLAESKANRFKTPLKIVAFVMVGTLGLAFLLLITRYTIGRIKNKKGYAILKDQKSARKREEAVRNLYVEKFDLPAEVLSLSNKEFLGYLSHKTEVSQELKDFYKSVDRVLYGKDYQKEDTLKIKNVKLKV